MQGDKDFKEGNFTKADLEIYGNSFSSKSK